MLDNRSSTIRDQEHEHDQQIEYLSHQFNEEATETSSCDEAELAIHNNGLILGGDKNTDLKEILFNSFDEETSQINQETYFKRL